MSGLRERKRIQTEKTILETSVNLFITNGYACTTVEEIANQADVSAGTVYNYYPAKSDILCGIVDQQITRVLESGNELLQDALNWPERALETMLWGFYESFLTIDLHFLREIMAISLQEADTVGRSMCALDQQLMNQLAELMEKLKEHKFLRPNLPVQQAAWMMYSSLMGEVFVLLQREKIDAKFKNEMRERLASNIDLMLRSWLV